MRVIVDIAMTGVASVARYPLRTFATVSVLCVILTPFLVGLGLSQGIEQESEWSLEAGPDLYVTATRFGRPAPVPLAAIDQLQKLPGVKRVTPRIVGPVTLGRDRIEAVVVGLPATSIHAAGNADNQLADEPHESDRVGARANHTTSERTSGLPEIIAGRVFAGDGSLELVLGAQLARQLHLQPGDRVPPFYRNRRGERVARVVGVFRPVAPLWQSKLIFTSLESASEIFDQAGMATELLVDCQAGYAESVRERILREPLWRDASRESPNRQSTWVQPNTDDRIDPPQLEVVSREQYRARLSRSMLHREGLVNLHYALLFVGGILVVLVTSGAGLDSRRREVAILKATGWQTDEILLRGACESMVLSVIGAGVSLLLAYGWLRGLNGWGIARLLLPGADAWPDFEVPFRLAPLPAFATVTIALAITLSGTLHSIWRAAVVPPWQAMR